MSEIVGSVCGQCNTEVHETLISTCEICNRNFCFVHRLPKDHDCIKPKSLIQRLIEFVKTPLTGKNRRSRNNRDSSKRQDRLPSDNLDSTIVENQTGIELPEHIKMKIDTLVEEGRFASEGELITKVLVDWFDKENHSQEITLKDENHSQEITLNDENLIEYAISKIDVILNDEKTPPKVFDIAADVKKQLRDEDIQIYNKITYGVFNFESMSKLRKIPVNTKNIIDELLTHFEEYSENMYS